MRSLPILDEEARPLLRHEPAFGPGSWYVALGRSAARLTVEEDARLLVLAAGLATLFFGFLASALLNLYLVAVNDPIVSELRTVLSYRSAILGDGLVLPLVNMTATSYLLRQRRHVGARMVLAALMLGAGLTTYVHVMQAANDLVNWSMPTPWHWNGIGAMHALYMFSVVSLLWLFLLVVIKVGERPSAIPREARMVLAGIVVFFFLLRWDYVSVELRWLPPVEPSYSERASSAIAATLEAIGVAPR